MDVSVVIPAYNEEESLPVLIPEVHEVLSGLGISFEILVVNDGSADQTARVLKELHDRFPQLHVIELEERSGQSAALDAGLRNAGGEVVVTMDADGQNDPADVPRLLELSKQHPVVCGIRKRRQDTLGKKIASRIGNWFRNTITGEKILDTGCSLKAFRAECIKDLPLFDGMHRFLPSYMKFKGYECHQVPVNHRPRTRGKTKYGNLDRARRGFWDCFAVRWMSSRYLNYKIREKY